MDGKTLAIKIQYPGVAESIDSDINNLVSILNFGNLFPKGMFLDNFIVVSFFIDIWAYGKNIKHLKSIFFIFLNIVCLLFFLI